MGPADPAVDSRGGGGRRPAIANWSRPRWPSSTPPIPRLLFDAMFASDQLDELAFDPRAYDFDHPVNKRPNYLFGQWDMNKLDGAGRCRRFVLQQVALDAMLDRLHHRGRLPREQVLFEEAAVLAGTMLMGSGISGNRPDAHDSTVTLATLVEKIAVYRDAFYEQLLRKIEGPARRAAAGRGAGAAAAVWRSPPALQPVPGPAAGGAVAARPSGAAARGHRLHRGGGPAGRRRAGCRGANELRDALPHGRRPPGRSNAGNSWRRPLSCRPSRTCCIGRSAAGRWSIPGISWGSAASTACSRPSRTPFTTIASRSCSTRWAIFSPFTGGFTKPRRRPATTPCNKPSRGTSPDWPAGGTSLPASRSARWKGFPAGRRSSRPKAWPPRCRAWHQGGAAAGDLAFWRRHVEHFGSPKAYAQVIDTLLDHRDPVAAMALLVQWLSQAEEIPLVEEDYSFHDLALAWMEDLWRNDESTPPRWSLTQKFLDYLEANAEEYWQVPQFEMAAQVLGAAGPEEDELAAEGKESEDEFPADEADDDEDGLFRAAYEDVTYRDSTDDGVEGELFEGGESPTDFELVGEAERIVSRLSFLTTVAQLWKLAATASLGASESASESGTGSLCRNGPESAAYKANLSRFPTPDTTTCSPAGSTRRRETTATVGAAWPRCIAIAFRRRAARRSRWWNTTAGGASRRRCWRRSSRRASRRATRPAILRASMARPPPAAGGEPWERLAGEALAAVLRGDAAGVRGVFAQAARDLAEQPLLYVALGQGGNPRRIVASRSRQYVLRRLLGYLPRLGLLTETCRLLETAQRMESRASRRAQAPSPSSTGPSRSAARPSRAAWSPRPPTGSG